MFVSTLVLTTVGLSRKLPTIKAIRSATACSLMCAKNLFELAYAAPNGTAQHASDGACTPSGVSLLTDSDGALLGRMSWIDCDSTAATSPAPEPPPAPPPAPRFVRHLLYLPADMPALVRPDRIVAVKSVWGSTQVEIESDIGTRFIATTATVEQVVACLEP